MRQPKWHTHEVALLIEVYCDMIKQNIPRKNVVTRMSRILRERARRLGQEIDDGFRNESGITMQMGLLDYIVTDGKKGMQNSSSLMKQLFELYRKSPEEFAKILQEAKQFPSNPDATREVTAPPYDRKEEFGRWLSETSLDSDTQQCYRTALNQVEEMCEPFGMLGFSLSEEIDPSFAEEKLKLVMELPIFKAQNNAVYRYCYPALEQYLLFLKFVKENTTSSETCKPFKETYPTDLETDPLVEDKSSPVPSEQQSEESDALELQSPEVVSDSVSEDMEFVTESTIPTEEVERTAESVPEVVEPVAETVESLPEAIETVSETVESVPEAVEPVTETIESVPEAVEPVAETIESAPEMVETVAETVESVPEVVEPVAETVESVPEVVEPVAETVESVPEVVEPVAETVESLPEVVEPVAEIVESVPEVIEPVTETVESIPEVVEPVAEIVESVPEVIEPVAETVESLPEAIEPVAETVESILEVVETVSETIESVPEAVEPVTETIESAPEVVETVGEAVESVPEAVEPVAETIESAPEMVEPVAEIVESVPEVVEAVTETAESALEVVEPVAEIVESVPDAVEPVTETLKTEDNLEPAVTLLGEAVTSFVKEEIEGVSFSDIYLEFSKERKSKLKEALSLCPLVEFADTYHHKDNLNGFDEMASVLLTALKKLFRNNDGYTSAHLLYRSVEPQLNAFFFYNERFQSKDGVYALANYLFSQGAFQDTVFLFHNKFHIWEKEPNYKKDFGGLLLHYARGNGNRFTREEGCNHLAYLGSTSQMATFSNATRGDQFKKFWQYQENSFVLRESLQITTDFIDAVKIQLNHLLGEDEYISFGDISEDFYRMNLPDLCDSIPWSPLLLADFVRCEAVGYGIMEAGHDNERKTIPAVLVVADSGVQTFPDVLIAAVMEEYTLPKELSSTEFRDFLLEYGFIHGNEKTQNVHKVTEDDYRFLWTDNNKKVMISS